MNGATKAHNNQIKAIARIESLNPTNKNKRTKPNFFFLAAETQQCKLIPKHLGTQ